MKGGDSNGCVEHPSDTCLNTRPLRFQVLYTLLICFIACVFRVASSPGRGLGTRLRSANSPLAYAMSELFKDMWSSDEDGRQVEVAADVLRALVKGNRWFAGNGQHDAHEALRSVLDLLHEELRRPVSDSRRWGLL